ncbi:MAG: cell division protein FtsZ, partial [Phocaeicola sp.]
AVTKILNDGCKMTFITAGMGGGTGTGAGPIIAKAARELGILTVGIVTIPFRFEGNKKIDKALDGVEEISKYVDALLVINNERLREVYSNMSLMGGFAEADDTLSIAAKSIAEIITIEGKINLDFNDVKTVLKDGGVAIMSTGFGEGDTRVTKAIQSALNSPLLNNNDVFNSKKVLFNISYSSEKEIMMEEMNEIHDFMIKFDRDVETKWGVYIDETLGEKVKFTILATGFGIKNVPGMEQKMTREDEQKVADLEEQEDKNRIRRDDFYGKGDSQYLPRKKKYYNYIFSGDDLDNDELINELEANPTYLRNRNQLERIQSKHREEDISIVESDGDDTKIIF